MENRPFGRTGRNVSVVGLGTWQLGADWGEVSEDAAIAVLAEAVADGVTLLDTADVYGDGRSESLIGSFLAERPEVRGDVLVATKMGRRAAQVPESYVAPAFRQWVDRSRANLRVDTLDLVQLHCPPSEVIASDAVYDALDALVSDGSIAAYGVSVETCEQALAAIARPGVASVQIILNPFRLKPVELVLPAARAAGVGILARVPLASGLLSGRYTPATTFGADDHRTFNRRGEAFDRGETFSGVEYETGLRCASELAAVLPDGVGLAAASLAWIVSRPGVTSVIPGARTPGQVRSNAAAAALLEPGSGFDVDVFDAVVRRVYDEHLRASIHPRW